MSIRLGTSGSARSDINVTPFIDIALVLLILFMVMMPLADRGYAVTTAAARPTSGQRSQPLEIELRRDGQVTLGGILVPAARLPAALASALAGIEERRARLRIADERPYTEVTDLLDLIRRSGTSRISLDLGQSAERRP